MESASEKKKDITSIGWVFSLPTILDPSHRISASQKMYIMVGVPEPAKNKKAVESVVRKDPTMATSDLNQRLRSKTMNKAAKTEIMMDGSLME